MTLLTKVTEIIIQNENVSLPFPICFFKISLWDKVRQKLTPIWKKVNQWVVFFHKKK